MPISKHFSPGSPDSRMGRRRPRLEITREMISAPLGDFRHTMHVGRGGDAFGDTSFLRERPPPENPRYRRGESPPPAGRESLLARTLRASKRSLSVGRSARLSSTSTSSFVAVPLPSSPSSSASASSYSASTPSSPVGVSQPLSRSEMEVQCIAPPGGERASRSPGPVRTPLAPVGSIAGVTAGFSPYSGGGGGGNAIARPNGAMDGQEPLFDRRDQALAHSIPVLKHAESVMSFHVDLGPSMLGDVLGVMGSEEGGAAAPGFEVVAAAAPAATPGRGGSSRGGSRSSSASSSGGSSATLADDAASQGDGEGDGGAWAAAASEKRPAALPAALPTMPFVASLHHHHHPFGSYLEDDEILPF